MTWSEALSLVRLVPYRLLQRSRRALDESGKLARFEVAEQRRIREQVLEDSSLSAWLGREGGGRFWLRRSAARRWAAQHCSAEDLAWAEEVVSGRSSLLGVESLAVGNPPVWRRDFYSGREWPLDRSSRLSLIRGDGSDIRTVWELSRCYHFVVLAKAFWRTGDPRFVESFRSHVESWLAENPVGRGPNWRSPMDAAIRAANWVLAVLLFAESEQLSAVFWSRVLANLRVTGRFVVRQLEWHPRYRGNHYLSNAVGLVYLGALFRDDSAGRRWLARGARILRKEMDFQVYPDGVSREAALGYHRLVTEFFAFGGDLCERNGHPLPASFWSRLGRMYEFIASYVDAEGLAPLLGDGDDGRLHMLCAESYHQPRAHRLGLPRRLWRGMAPGSAAFSEGGFYVLRGGRSQCVIRCGPVGLRGAGSHDHNDQLSYELVLDGRPLITDSGTFAYTRDLGERFAFRATAAHNAIQVGEAEQNPIRPELPWRVLGETTRARCLEWLPEAGGGSFSGEHQGFAGRPSGARCRRRIVARFDRGEWSASDRVEGEGRERITWRVHFAPGELSCLGSDGARWAFAHSSAPGYGIRIVASAALELSVGASRLSERYGHWMERPLLVLRGEVALPFELELTVSAAGD